MIPLAPGAAMLAGESGLLCGGLLLLAQRTETREAADDLKHSLVGAAGERRVARALNRAGFHAIHDITLKDRKAHTTRQIDHIVAAGDSLWVLETKTWRGTITFTNQQRCTVRSTGRSFGTVNPVAQNAQHTDLIRRVAGHRATSLVLLAGKTAVSGPTPPGVLPLRDAIAELQAAGPPTPRALIALAALRDLQKRPQHDHLRRAHIARLRGRHSRSRPLYVAASLFLTVSLAAVATGLDPSVLTLI